MRKCVTTTILLLSLAVHFSSSSHASILIMADPIEPKKPEEKKISIKMALLYLNDNRSWLGSTENRISYDNNILECSLFFQKELSKTSEDERLKDSQKIQAAFDYYLFTRLEYFIFYSYEYDRVNNLRHRHSGAVGLKFVINRNKIFTTDLSYAPVYEVEELQSEGREDVIRHSIRFRSKIVFVKGLENRFQIFYIPRYDSFEEYRIEVTDECEYKLNKLFSILVKYKYLYQPEYEETIDRSQHIWRVFAALNY